MLFVTRKVLTTVGGPHPHLFLCLQARDVERRKEQERGAAILQQQLAERQAQRIREEELRDQVGAQHTIKGTTSVPHHQQHMCSNCHRGILLKLHTTMEQISHACVHVMRRMVLCPG